MPRPARQDGTVSHYLAVHTIVQFYDHVFGR